MKATITKIDPPRIGRNGKPYHLVCFKLEKGGSAVSFISEKYDNYTRWKPLLEVGNILEGLEMKSGFIDADSPNPTLFFKPEKQPELF